MSLIRKSNSTSSQVPSQLIGSLSRGLRAAVPTMDRRTFLRRSGIGVGAGIAATQLNMLQKANAADPKATMLDGKGKIEVKRTICSHCSVGCSFDATVENGVWVRQDPVFESPINMGGACAKGAALREHGHGDYRLRTPMKLVDGKYQKISWDQALDEISAKMKELRTKFTPDSIFLLVHQSTTMSKLIYCVSLFRSTAPTILTTRPVSATPPQLQVWQTPGVMAR